jgi:ubiquinone/menaquinone biosynthesis C-methylase UbiE
MDKPKSGLDFKLMALFYRVRDRIFPRREILQEAGIKEGARVLDFGCGPGSYLLPLAESVGPSGKIYALDIHPLALKRIREIASKKHLSNVETIHSDGPTGLPDQSLDVVLLYDTFHDLKDGEAVLKEILRVLRLGGILSFSDHHMREEEILAGVAGQGLFRLLKKGKKTYSFASRE